MGFFLFEIFYLSIIGNECEFLGIKGMNQKMEGSEVDMNFIG